MLDFNKLSTKISNITLRLTKDSQESQERLKYALEVWSNVLDDDKELGDKITSYIDKFPWGVARPLEPLNNITPLPDMKDLEKFTVVATDGSQISPSHHEISFCYLINVGLILYTYGTGDKTIQESEPYIYNIESDYSQRKQHHISVDDLIPIKRMLTEMSELVSLCKKAKERTYPSIALSDGTLINWSISNQMFTEEFQNQILGEYLQYLDEIKSLGVPICGYISNSRRNDVVNMLRVQICPYKTVDCENFCSEKEACSQIVPLYDRQIWEYLLNDGERSPIFASTSKILQKYKDHQICFFYINVGYEIARIEVPRWVIDDEYYLNLIHYIVYFQVKVGMGYPIVIAEAHNQAVIKGPDRAQFYAMLSRKMIDRNMKVLLSNKELKKRSGIV